MITFADTSYVIDGDDFTMLRAISAILTNGDYLDDKQRRDLGHKIWTIIENAHEVTRDD